MEWIYSEMEYLVEILTTLVLIVIFRLLEGAKRRELERLKEEVRRGEDARQVVCELSEVVLKKQEEVQKSEEALKKEWERFTELKQGSPTK